MEFETTVGVCTCVLVSVLALLLSLAFFQYSSRKPKELILLFIDAPDPDNPAAAAAIYKNLLLHNSSPGRRRSTVHIVLTGRPVDLKTAKNDLRVSGSDILRQEWEKSEPIHARKLLEDSAARIHNYLVKCNVEARDIAIYDGGIAPTAPLSDVVHDWDFLFDRKDLITNQPGDEGEILTPQEYTSLVAEFSDLTAQEREQRLIALLRPYSLRPLSHLRKQMESSECSKVVIFLGGPATALVRLFSETKEHVQLKVVSLYGMFGSLRPGVATLLPNQFNVSCDVEAACNLFIDSNMLPLTDKYLITTETAKNDVFMISADDLSGTDVPSYFVDLQRLWESTHEGRVQPMFDVLPILASMDKYKDCFSWLKKKAVLYEWTGKERESRQVFNFIDTGEGDAKCIFVSDSSTSSLQHLDKTVFLEFMHKVWT